MALEGAPDIQQLGERIAAVGAEDPAEELRLQTLWNLGLLDSEPEPEFDELVQLACEVCDTPISLVSLVDRHRQWFKAAVGLAAQETHRDYSFCSHAIEAPGMMVVENAEQDERFKDNPLVTGDPNIRFYAGVPLRGRSGVAVGTLCVIDTLPRTLSPRQRGALTILARQVQTRIELRGERIDLQIALAENMRMAERLAHSRDSFRAFMEHGPFVSYLKDSEGRMIFYNSALANQFGVDQQAWIGLRDDEIWPQEIAKSFRSVDVQVLESKASVETREISPAADGGVTHWKSVKFPIRNEHGGWILGGVSLDITQEIKREAELTSTLQALEQANARLLELATTDSLTGLKTRRSFDEMLQREFAIARRKVRSLSVLMIDVDHFKERNDRFGHAAGDEALRLIGKILRETVRAEDCAARLGGEEFGIILTDADAPGATQTARRIQLMLRETPCPSGVITVSIGIATRNATVKTGHRLVVRADDAMYEAKRAGRDRIVAHHKHLEALIAEVAAGAPPRTS